VTTNRIKKIETTKELDDSFKEEFINGIFEAHVDKMSRTKFI
jgi:hypothetical protein